MQNQYELHYPVIAPLLMCSGIGDGKTTACVMAQAATINALRKGKTLDEPTDEMECACPVLRRLAIRLNDGKWWKNNNDRTEILRPLIPLLLDSKGSRKLMERRMYHVVDAAVREIVPMCLDERFPEHAKALRELPRICDKETALGAQKVARSAADAAADAADAADAAAYAAYAADAAAYAAAADAADAADAAAYAAAYAAPRIPYRDALLKAFRECAAMSDFNE